MGESHSGNRMSDNVLGQEWLITNGLGGYASSTLACLNTRKYHGLLVAALTPPVRRMVLLSRLEETVRAEGWAAALDCAEYPGTVHPEGQQLLVAFSPEPFPRWAYQSHGWTLEKSVCLLQGRNTVLVRYTLLGGQKPVELEIRPLFALRPMHELMFQWNARLDPEFKSDQHHRIPPTLKTPEVFFAHDGVFANQGYWYLNAIYRCEQDRGYSGLEDLWSPGTVRWTLQPGQTVCFACSTDPVDLSVVKHDADKSLTCGPAAGVVVQEPANELDILQRAAREFVVHSSVNPGTSESGVAVITDYPWAAPSVRNALIAFPGLFLVTGRLAEGRIFLRSLLPHLKNGLLPSELPENASLPVYRGADVSLWFIHAIHQYLRYAKNEPESLEPWLDTILKIIDAYRHGSDLGIGTDADGLLTSHAPGIGTTWMDAKVADWVVTQRDGRAVEVNALWYNALRVATEFAERLGQHKSAEELHALAQSVRAAFNERFWNDAEHCCYDVLEDHGRDPSVRPNQILAISLPFPVLAPERHPAVLQKLKGELLTAYGLRTLSPGDRSYQGRYLGNVLTRDRAYHQGTVYPWLLGPFISAYLRVHGRDKKARDYARSLVERCLVYMRSDGQGQLCELFDGDAPHRAGGSIASARSIGELLRTYVEDILDQQPSADRPQAALQMNLHIPENQSAPRTS